MEQAHSEEVLSILLDTNVLLYTVDPRDRFKRDRANSVVQTLGRRPDVALSAQTLAEFCNAALRKFALSPDGIGDYIRQYERSFTVHPLTAAIVSEALRGVRDYRLAYYDAQMWACARLNNLEAVFSEDFNPGATLEGVAFVNPFAPEFDVAAWGS